MQNTNPPEVTSNDAAEHCRLNRAVTFARGTRYEFTLAAGSIAPWEPAFNNHRPAATEGILVEFAGRHVTVGVDEADDGGFVGEDAADACRGV